MSGFYLWLPKIWTWRQIRNVTWFKGGLRAKARDFNWHNAIGFWSAVPLAVVVLQRRRHFVSVGEQPRLPDRG